MTVAFGMAFIALTFIFLRQLRVLNDAEALLLTAFCAVHPIVLFYSAQVMTEIPFSALALAALILGQIAMRRDARVGWAAGCGILVGCSVVLRVLGVPILGGILIAAIVRKAWRQAAILLSFAAPCFFWQVWKALSTVRFIPSTGMHPGPGFQQTWIYYMSYIAMRRLNVGNLQVFKSMLESQVIYLFTHVPGFFLGSFFDAHIGLWFLATVLVLAAVGMGMIHLINLRGWQPIHFALPLYVALVLLWDYPEIQRFLIPFLPLFAASLWIEGRYIAAKLTTAIASPRSAFERSIALVTGLAAVALMGILLWNFVANSDRRQLHELSSRRSILLGEKREAYQWIRDNTPVDARTVAGEDACLYLYTGRPSMSFIALSRVGAFEQARLQNDLDHMTDVARAINAQYWIASSDDSDKQWKSAKPFLEARLNQIESVLPRLFRSSAGHVQIYDLSCVRHPEDRACASADGVLFPVENMIRDQQTNLFPNAGQPATRTSFP
jgi:hypothetical protein